MKPADLEIIRRALTSDAITSEEAEQANEALADTYEESLRDRFAMAALQGVCASGVYCATPSEQAHLAVQAYALADAMLRERSKPIDSQFAEVE